MNKTVYDEMYAQADWHEKSLHALVLRERRRQARISASFAAYWGIATAFLTFAGIVGWMSGGPSEGASALAGGVCIAHIIDALWRRRAPPKAEPIEDEFGLAVRIYLARKLQGAVHGKGVEGNIADAERDRRRLGLPDIPMERR